MDIDTTDTTSGQSRPQPTSTSTPTSTQVKIHPLVIIGISDHQTRITTGGGKTSSSLLDVNDNSTNSVPTNDIPIIGLLFGYQNGLTVTIIDAEEVEYPSLHSASASSSLSRSSSDPVSTTNEKEKHQNIKTKIELHQKVFPNHEVVGWYRVDLNKQLSNDDDHDDMVLPTENDLIINNGWMKEYNESPIFVLMDGNEGKTSDGSDETMNLDTSNSSDQGEGEKDPKKKKNVEDARDKLDRDEQLPIAVYETMIAGGNSGNADGAMSTAASGSGGMVFINLDFELETFEPERIAVEKVFQTQPKHNAGGTVTTTTTTTTAAAAAVSGTKNDEPEKVDETSASAATAATSTTVIQQTQSEVQIQSIISSIEAMNIRIAVLLDFLQKTQSGEIPPNHALLRQVQSLINQLPLVIGKGIYGPTSTSGSFAQNEENIQNGKLAVEFRNEYDDMMVVSFLATIATTTKAVLSYAEKFKIVSESKGKGKEHGKTRYDPYKDNL